jgi:hypothetical protein
VEAAPGKKAPSMELRPLGFGEIFDRAVTLYIRNFIPFAAIVMVLVLPLAVLQYFLDRAAQPQFDAILKVFTDPGHTVPESLPTIYDSPVTVGILIAIVLVVYLIWPFSLNAVAVGVARLYRSRSVDFRACYEVVLRRWSQILALMFVEFLILVGWYVAAILVVVAVVFAVAALSAASTTFAIWFGFIGFVVVIAAMLPLLAPLFVALTFAMYATVIEESPVVASLAQGFARVFNRAEFWRALLFAIATGAVVAGASTAFSLLGMVAAFAHLPSVEAIIESLSRAVIGPFGVVLLAIYYFDVRIRREGFDLESSLERLAGAQPA